MNIALICDEEKKEATLEFCQNYENILKNQKIYIPQDLSEILAKKIKFNFVETLYSKEIGKQQILAKIFYGEINMLLFFKSSTNLNNQKNIDFILLNLCNEQNIPFATNFKTAEILLKILI